MSRLLLLCLLLRCCCCRCCFSCLLLSRDIVRLRACACRELRAPPAIEDQKGRGIPRSSAILGLIGLLPRAGPRPHGKWPSVVRLSAVVSGETAVEALRRSDLHPPAAYHAAMSAAVSGNSTATFVGAVVMRKDETDIKEHSKMLIRSIKVRRPRSTSAPWHGHAGAAAEAEDGAGAAKGGDKQAMHVRVYTSPLGDPSAGGISPRAAVSQSRGSSRGSRPSLPLPRPLGVEPSG